GMLGKKFREDQKNPDFNFKDIPFYEYDPGIPEKMHDKSRAELLINTDVLEHIEPQFLDSVLADMGHRTLRVAFLVISCVPAVHRLPDGRNAHLIIEHPNWWIEQLNKYFIVSKAEHIDGELYIIALRKPAEGEKKTLTPEEMAINEARQCIEDKKFVAARTLLTRVKNQNFYPEVLFLFGKIYFATNDLIRASGYFIDYAELTRDPEAYRMAGIALAKVQRFENARRCLEQEICVNAFLENNSEYVETLMLCWNKTQEPASAIRTYEARAEKTAEMTVQYVDALILDQNYDKALAVALKAAEDHPDYAETWGALERAYAILKKFPQALKASQKAAALAPNDSVYQCNLGLCYLNLARIDEAMKAFDRAIELDPLMMAAYLNRSTIHRFKKDNLFLESELQAAYEIDPSSADVHYGIGVNALRKEQYEKAFAEIEWYWHKNKLTSGRIPTSIPRWYGEDIKGKTLMFFADQGVGDIIMMMRFIPEVVEKYKPKKIIFNIHKKLQGVFLATFPELFASGQGEFFKDTAVSVSQSGVDMAIAATTLPHVLGTTITSVPSPEGYLKTVAKKDYKTGSDKEFVIGISWYTRSQDGGYIRSLRLADFAFLSKYKNIRIIDLQYGDTSAERAENAAAGFDIFHDETVDSWAEMQPLVDQIAACDLVISIDNATVHTAGALGTPCWVLLPQEAYWRWPISGESSPWYESLRLFRQTENRSYPELIGYVQQELEKYLGGDKSVLLPPKFKPIFPLQEKPAKRAVIINDTGTCYTWGNYAAMEGMKAELAKRGYGVETAHTLGLHWVFPHTPSLQDFDNPKFLSACRYRDTTLFHNIQHADIVVINGEGMMDNLSDSAVQLLYLAYVSKRVFGKKVVFVNFSCFPEGGMALTDAGRLAFYHKVFTQIDDCVVREACSLDLIKSIGTPVRLGFDTSLLYLKSWLAAHPVKTRKKTAVITAGPGYESFMGETMANLYKGLQAAGYEPIVLQGAKWHGAQEDRILANDLEEVLGTHINKVVAKSFDEFMEHLATSSLAITGFYHIALLSTAMGIQTIPLTTGPNGFSMLGLAKSARTSAPLVYEDPNLGTKLAQFTEGLKNKVLAQPGAPIGVTDSLYEKAMENFGLFK
ncbi:MAG: polysaccharide pyruvyl transferase family protein, partial [Alphaproteobacteria bacterium]|nr:polysaccharide pyruvyl transferase family protein [Alphaproteobacteria bacterium]